MAVRDGRVIDIGRKFGHEGTYDFAGVSIWNPHIFARLPAATEDFVHPHSRSIGSAQGGKIGGVILNERKWFNIGSRDGISGSASHDCRGRLASRLCDR